MLDEGFGGTTAEELVEALSRPSKLTEKESREYVMSFWKKPKEIDFQILKKIIDALDNIWDEEDEDYPNRRRIGQFERGIDNNLKKLNADKEMEEAIYATHHRFHPTYEAQCDALRAKGYIIINNGKEEKR